MFNWLHKTANFLNAIACSHEALWAFYFGVPFQYILLLELFLCYRYTYAHTHQTPYYVYSSSTRLDSLFTFRTTVILLGMNLMILWKYFFSNLGPCCCHGTCNSSRFVVCTSRIQISLSTTSQKCSMWSRSPDYGNK